MSRIFSWKVGTGKYAYLVKSSETNKYIRNRITDTDKLIEISNIVREYSESEYANEFSGLRNEVLEVYNYDLGDYGQYYQAGDSETNIVLLTGKDGDNYNQATRRTSLTENDYKEIQKMIDAAIKPLFDAVSANNTTLISDITSRTSGAVAYALSSYETTQSELAEMKEELIAVTNNALDATHNVEAILNTGEGNITLRDIVTAYTNVTESQAWLNENKESLQMIQTDYTQTASNLDTIGNVFTTINNNVINVSNTIENEIQNINNNIDTINNKIDRVSNLPPSGGEIDDGDDNT